MPPEAPVLFDAELTTFLTGPVSMILGTADRMSTPDATRVAGMVRIGDTRVRLLISTEADTAKANATAGTRASVLVTDITNYRSIQWKGVIVQEPTPRTPGDLAIMHRHVAAFNAGSALVGIRPEVLPAIFPDDVVAIEIEVDARYDQTPGTGAGRQVA